MRSGDMQFKTDAIDFQPNTKGLTVKVWKHSYTFPPRTRSRHASLIEHVVRRVRVGYASVILHFRIQDIGRGLDHLELHPNEELVLHD